MVPAPVAAKNTSNLAQKPTVGGMPARANRNVVSATASNGERVPRPLKSVSARSPVLRLTAIATPNAPMFISV